MENGKKEALEKKAVFGLAALLALILVRGPVTQMFRSGARPVAPVAASAGLPAAPATPPAAAVPQAPTTEAAAAPTESAPLYTAHDLRDPTLSFLPARTALPPVAVPESGDGLAEEPAKDLFPATISIQGIVWGGPKPFAIINGQTYAIAQVYGGAEIVAIERGGVTLGRDGETKFYPMSRAAGSTRDGAAAVRPAQAPPRGAGAAAQRTPGRPRRAGAARQAQLRR